MVSILAYVVEVLFFLELSSALSHNDVLGVSNKTDAETITDSFLKIPEQLLPDENFADADANRRYAEVSLPDAISEENHDKTRESGESDGKDAGDKHDDGKIDNKEKIADSTTADDHSKASDQKDAPPDIFPPGQKEMQDVMEAVVKTVESIPFDEILKSIPGSIITNMTPTTIVGWVGAFILTLLVIIVGSFVAIIIIIGTVTYNRWDIILVTLIIYFLARMYRRSLQKEKDHKD